MPDSFILSRQEYEELYPRQVYPKLTHDAHHELVARGGECANKHTLLAQVYKGALRVPERLRDGREAYAWTREAIDRLVELFASQDRLSNLSRVARYTGTPLVDLVKARRLPTGHPGRTFTFEVL